MTFDWLAFSAHPHIDLSFGLAGIVVTGAHLAGCLVLVMRSRQPRATFGMFHWLALAGLMIAAAVFAQVTVVRLSGPGLSNADPLPLLGLLPLAACALWLGIGPAVLVGFVTGLSMSLFGTGRVTQPLEMALTGGLIASLISQPYRGRVAGWLRLPAVAVALGAISAEWPLELLGRAVTDGLPFFGSLDRTITLFLPSLAGCLAAGLIAGLIIQGVVRQWPYRSPQQAQPLTSVPWDRHLGQRMAYALAPLAALSVAGLVGVVAITAYAVATNVIVEQMGRSASNVGSSIPLFIQQGRGLIRNLAATDQLRAADPHIRQDQLIVGLRGAPIFQQLIYVDQAGAVANAFPPGPDNGTLLSPQEMGPVMSARQGGTASEVIVYDPQGAFVSFVTAVGDQGSRANGALIGRASLTDNPALAPIVGILRAGAGAGRGMLLDSQNRVILAPGQPYLGAQPFDLSAGADVAGALSPGRAYRLVNDDGTGSLVYWLPVNGLPDWSVVLIEPNEIVLRLAIQIAVPALILLVLILGAVALLGVVVTRSITHPLEELLKVAHAIGDGNLDHPVDIPGEDEIGQLGSAFEQMRLRLKGRLEEQELLLRVSRSVSSSLELFRAMPPILSSALDVTHAAGARIALRRGDNGLLQVYSAGEAAAAMAALDNQLTDLVERQGTVVISQVQRASGSLDVKALPPTIHALVALPLRSENSFHGALWLTYDHEHQFEQSELTFLGTLAGQAAVAVANARLLAEAQEGRQNLEAILESTADGMIVVDNTGKVALMNPAAEQQFGIRLEQARGRAAAEVIAIPELATLLTDLKEPVAALELPGPNGKTLLANTSTIVGRDGTMAGRVTLLRDITPIKELDNIKTVFLRMVSHDLRSPLTYMRGYVSLMPIAGELNASQEDALSKINMGIQHISEMTERLLYLSRLKFGDEAELELILVDVEEMIRDVEAHLKSAAADKQISLTVEVDEKLPLLLVDGMLYQQAISNLIGNGIKYTPEGGRVTAHAYLDGPDRLTVSVTDDGPGIRPEDQEHLFEAFYRAPQREGDSPRPAGTGLGLALVKAIADTHNGSIEVDSTFGKGSTFRLIIPIRNPSDF